jgi:hypothetical protein
MNRFFLTECPCRSRNMKGGWLLAFLTFWISFLISNIYGDISGSGDWNYLFKSRPYKHVLKLPAITPSGLSMGIAITYELLICIN